MTPLGGTSGTQVGPGVGPYFSITIQQLRSLKSLRSHSPTRLASIGAGLSRIYMTERSKEIVSVFGGTVGPGALFRT